LSVYARVLHSVPTRRSSDLDAIEVDSSIGEDFAGGNQVFESFFRDEPAGGEDATFAVGRAQRGRRREFVELNAAIGDVKLLIARSEEHTSELQSRVDLVCRL